jgi:hypothetical protein
VPQLCQRNFSESAYDFASIKYTNVCGLPRLPIPELDGTVERYLRSVEPFCSPDEYAAHTNLVAKSKAELEYAHNKLVAHDKQCEVEGTYPFSFIERDWDEMYRGGRWAIPINNNPGYIFTNGPPETQKSQAQRVATVVHSSLKFFFSKFMAGKFDFDVARDGTPNSDVSQFPYQFSTGRQPRESHDNVKHFHDAQHVVVLCDGHYYTVNVRGDPNAGEGEAYASIADMEKAFEEIVAHAKTTGQGEGVGVLTSKARADWHNDRVQLEMSSKVNADTLEAIDSAILVVCLDTAAPTDCLQTNSEIVLHGLDNGSNSSSNNRWFDKMSLIASADGQTLGANFEHSHSDGITWNRWLTEVWSDAIGQGDKSGYTPLPAGSGTAACGWNKLGWELSGASKNAIAEQRANFKNDTENLGTVTMEFDQFGRGACKEWKISPDAVAQMAFQLAYFRQHGAMPPTYEACAMRQFHHGRTETIRSSSVEARDWAQAMMNPAVSNDEKKELFTKAANMHINLAKAAQAGNGVDRHLTALQNMCLREGWPVPAFMDDALFSHSKTWKLSTSNVTTPMLKLFNFGAVSHDGYGIGYMTHPSHIPINITWFKDNDETDGELMAQNVEKSLVEIADMLNQ